LVIGRIVGTTPAGATSTAVIVSTVIVTGGIVGSPAAC
jgi:hypothetical protein